MQLCATYFITNPKSPMDLKPDIKIKTQACTNAIQARDNIPSSNYFLIPF